jgi:hypothetical protein
MGPLEKMEDMEFLKAMLAEMNANTKANQEEMLARMQEKMGANTKAK